MADERRVITFHIAGGWGGKATAKGWPLEHFVSLAQRIVLGTDRHVLVLCGPNEREAAAELYRDESLTLTGTGIKLYYNGTFLPPEAEWR